MYIAVMSKTYLDAKVGDVIRYFEDGYEHFGRVEVDPEFVGGLKIGGRSVKNIYDEADEFDIL